MGAGCYYTNHYFDSEYKRQDFKAVWLQLDSEELEKDEDYYTDQYEWLFESVLEVLTNHDNACRIQYEIYTAMYRIWLEPKYDGDGLVIKLEPANEDDKIAPLARANIEENYYSIINRLQKKMDGAEFRIASSSYTSGIYSPDDTHK